MPFRRILASLVSIAALMGAYWKGDEIDSFFPLGAVGVIVTAFWLIEGHALVVPNARKFFSRSDWVGRLSVAAGVLALSIASLAAHFKAIYHQGTYYVLAFLHDLGLTRRGSGVTEVRKTSIYTIGDENAIFLLSNCSHILAALAILLALITVRNSQETQLPSIGFICAVLAIVVSAKTIGMLVLAGCLVLILVVKHRYRGPLL